MNFLWNNISDRTVRQLHPENKQIVLDRGVEAICSPKMYQVLMKLPDGYWIDPRTPSEVHYVSKSTDADPKRLCSI